MLSARPISFNGDVDAQQPILNAKTPGRRTLKGRSVLQENALHNGAKTVLSKKNILQTPFRPGTAHAGKKPLVSISVTRPLMDKTPFPNRIAAASFGGAGPAGKTPGGTKLSKLALLISEPQPQQQSLSPDVAPLLRPSSARKSLRGRLSGSNFKTPLTKGNYWDVSPGDMDGIGGVANAARGETDSEIAVAVDDEDDEIEYMPPTAVELPYEPPFEMPDYKAMGRALFALGHGGLADDTADVYYAMDIEQQVDIKQLCADAGFTSARSDDSGLWLPELEDDSPFARKPKPKSTSTSGPVPVPPSQAEGRGRPPTSKSASSIPLVRAASTRTTSSSRTQPTSAVQARPATTTPPNQSRPTSASSSSRLPQPTIVVAPGQTRTSALRAAKAAAAAAAAAAPSASAGLSAPKANPSAATRRAAFASAPSSSSTPANIAAGGGQTQTQPKTKTRMQAQAPPTHSGRQAKVQAQAQARAPGETRPITIARSVTSGAISSNANGYAKTIMTPGTGVGAGAGTGAGVPGASTRARSATVMAVNANANARVLGGASGVKGTGTGARGAAGGKGEGDELAAALEKAIGDGLLALGGTEDFAFDV